MKIRKSFVSNSSSSSFILCMDKLTKTQSNMIDIIRQLEFIAGGLSISPNINKGDTLYNKRSGFTQRVSDDQVAMDCIDKFKYRHLLCMSDESCQLEFQDNLIINSIDSLDKPIIVYNQNVELEDTFLNLYEVYVINNTIPKLMTDTLLNLQSLIPHLIINPVLHTTVNENKFLDWMEDSVEPRWGDESSIKTLMPKLVSKRSLGDCTVSSILYSASSDVKWQFDRLVLNTFPFKIKID